MRPETFLRLVAIHESRQTFSCDLPDAPAELLMAYSILKKRETERAFGLSGQASELSKRMECCETPGCFHAVLPPEMYCRVCKLERAAKSTPLFTCCNKYCHRTTRNIYNGFCDQCWELYQLFLRILVPRIHTQRKAVWNCLMGHNRFLHLMEICPNQMISHLAPAYGDILAVHERLCNGEAPRYMV